MFAAAFAMLVLAVFTAVLVVLSDRRQQVHVDESIARMATRPLAPVAVR